MENYIAQRLAALSTGKPDTQNEIDALKTENEHLKQQLSKMPQTSFKSEAQTEFELSKEFEQILSFFYMRFLRDKFAAEFRASSHNHDFQQTANKAFEQFEKSTKKEVNNHAQTSEEDSRLNGADTGTNA